MIHTRLPILIAMLMLAGSTAGIAQDTPAFDFLRLPVNARAAGIGNSYVTGMNDPAAVFMNPGSIGTLKSMQGSAGFFKHITDVNAGYLAFAKPYDSLGTFSVAVEYMNYGSMDRTDVLGNKNGTFGAGDLALSVGYGSNYRDLYYGASVKYLHESIDTYSASALAVDLGLLYVIPKQEMTLGISVLNVGAELSSFGHTKEKLPFEVKIGASKKLEHLPLTVFLNFHKLTESQSNLFNHLAQFSIGGEILFSQYFRGRVGFNNETRKEMKIGSSSGLAGFSLGFGIYLQKFTIDYSYTSWGLVGDLHRFGVNLLFN